jgi:predicted nicotinamide N-methyase
MASGMTDRRRAGTHQVAQLRTRMERQFALHDLDLHIPGASRVYRIALPADPDAPLDRFAAQTRQVASELDAAGLSGAAAGAREAVAAGAHMPYWGLLWPSGLALAEAVLAYRDRVRGRQVLELGCGLGVTATAALDAGARLWAADCFGEALLFTRYNALRNDLDAPRSLLLDWRTEAGREACVAASPFDLLLAADVLYEHENVAPLLDLAPRLLSAGAEFWLAEPGRRVSLAFVAEAHARGWQDEETTFERAWPPDGDHIRVAVHRFTRVSPSP